MNRNFLKMFCNFSPTQLKNARIPINHSENFVKAWDLPLKSFNGKATTFLIGFVYDLNLLLKLLNGLVCASKSWLLIQREHGDWVKQWAGFRTPLYENHLEKNRWVTMRIHTAGGLAHSRAHYVNLQGSFCFIYLFLQNVLNRRKNGVNRNRTGRICTLKRFSHLLETASNSKSAFLKEHFLFFFYFVIYPKKSSGWNIFFPLVLLNFTREVSTE